MRTTFTKINFSILSAVIAIAGVIATTPVAYAGSLTPPGGTATSTSYTLSDIYNQVASGTAATAGNHALSTTTAPAPSFHSLTDIYNAVVNLRSSLVSLANMWNGSCNNADTCPLGTEFPGGSASRGGIDDFNWNYTATTTPLIPAPGRYATTWVQCTSGNSYCGTGDTAANAKDEATGLIWSWLCTGSGCASFDMTEPDPLGDQNAPSYYWNSDTFYSWDNSGTNNTGASSTDLCSQHSGWYLPDQKQLMQAYIDGSYGNLDPVGVDRTYWSATTLSNSTAFAWYVDLAYGDTNLINKYDPNFTVRCIRE